MKCIQSYLLASVIFCISNLSNAGELVGSEQEREQLYPNVVPPDVTIGVYGFAVGQLSDIRDVEFDTSRTFFVSECAANRIQKFDLSGTLVAQYPTNENSYTLACPSAVAASEDSIFIVEHIPKRVSAVSRSTGELRWRKTLSDFFASTPRNIAAVGDKLAITDRYGVKILLLSHDGRRVDSISTHGFGSIADIAAVGRSEIAVSDLAEGRFALISLSDGKIQYFSEYGSGPGQLANPYGITSTDGIVFVADTVNHRIQAFDREGKFLFQFGRHPISPQQIHSGRMHYPHNVAISPTGRYVVVCESFESQCNVFNVDTVRKQYVAVSESAWWDKFFWFHYRGPSRIAMKSDFDISVEHDYIFMGEEDINRIVVGKLTEGVPETLFYFGEHGTGPGQFAGPEGVFSGPKGDLYVSDTLNDRIQRFDLQGNFIDMFGERGDGPGQFDSPGQGATDSKGRLFVPDSGNDRIQVLSRDGEFLYEWGSPGTGPGEFNRPIDAYVEDSEDRVYVVDFYNRRIQVFDLEGKHQFSFGKEGLGPGEFVAPHSVVSDPKSGDIFVSDMVANSIQRFDANGNPKARYGGYGIAMGEFKTPAGLAVAGDRLYIMDHTNHRGQILSTEDGTALATFGENVIGVPTYVLEATKKVERLEAQIRDMQARDGEEFPKGELESMRIQLKELQETLSVPDALKER